VIGSSPVSFEYNPSHHASPFHVAEACQPFPAARPVHRRLLAEGRRRRCRRPFGPRGTRDADWREVLSVRAPR
jgi:hypothetical protein